MDADIAGQVEADEIYRVLMSGKHFDRELAQTRVAGLGDSSRAALRTMIITGLPDLRGDENVWTRSWLMSTLGRIADNDQAALDALREGISDYDSESTWVRYWALEGAVTGSVSSLAELSKIASEDPDPLPRYLGMAVAATTAADNAARQTLMDALESGNPEQQWLALRALRVMPVRGTETPIVAILGQPNYTEASYQAVVALGAVPRENEDGVETAALALLNLVVNKRRELMWTEARARALYGLGRLCFPGSAPTLVDELLDGNPYTVREAAIALETVLGTDRAVDRVVEAASADPASVVAFGQALRWMRRDAVAERLEQIGSGSHSDSSEAARALLTDVGGVVAFQKLQARARSMERYADVLDQAEESVREQFNESLNEARHGYTIATQMDTAVFVVGLVLLVGSAVGAFITEGSLATWATAGTGVAAVIYSLFIANPRKLVQESVDHLMYLKVVFLGYLRQLHQIDQVFSRNMLDDEPFTATEVQAFALLIESAMRAAIGNLKSLDGEGNLTAAADQGSNAPAVAVTTSAEAETVADDA